MCASVMTEELTHARIDADQTFVDPFCITNNGVFDLEKLHLLADRIKPLLGPRLENRIHSGLEEFVCKSSSRYSRRFPRVKRCLDAVAAWLNYLDAFRTKDIEEEAIKHAIEYLLKDGRVTHLEDPVVLNTGINGVDLDSLTEQNAMKNMNVWSFIKEKDYWLCQDQEQTTSTCKSPPRIHPQTQECKGESSSSDLDVEIGSSTKKLPTKVTQKSFCIKESCCNQNVNNLKSSEKEVEYDAQIASYSKQNTLKRSKEILTTINKSKPLQTRRKSSKPCEKISYDQQAISCLKQNTVNPSEETLTITNEARLLQSRRKLPKSSTKVSCEPRTTFCSKQNVLNTSEEVSTNINEAKLPQTGRNLPKSCTTVSFQPQITSYSKKTSPNPLEEISTITNEAKLLQTGRNLPKSSTTVPCQPQIVSCSKQNTLNSSEAVSTNINEAKFLQTGRNLSKPCIKVSCEPQITSCSKQNTQNSLEELSTNINEAKLLQTRRNLSKPCIKVSFEPQIISCSKQNTRNSLEEISTIANDLKPLQTGRNLPGSSTTVPCEPQITFCSKQNTCNSLQEASTVINESKLTQTRRKSKPCTKTPPNCIQNCKQNVCPKNRKLKLIIYKTTSTNGSTLWSSPKVSSLSLPCKSSHLIVRLFEADPSLSDSCLVLIRRKFEHDIRNACSCLNDMFKKIDSSTMKSLCLNCHIHPGRIDLNLQRDDGSSKVRLFLARVPICLNVHKRVSSCRKVKFEESQGSNKNLDYNEEFQERQIAFYSQCSNHGLMDEKRSSKCVTEKEVTFVWSRRETKEVDFVLSSTYIKLKEELKENSIPCTKENCNRVHEEDAEVLFRTEEKDTCTDSSVTEDDNQRKLGHICASSSGSSKEEEQDDSTMGGCNPERCFCHVLCANSDRKTVELENSIQKEECVPQLQDNVEESKTRLEIYKEAEENVYETKSSTLRTQDFSKLERNIVTVRNSTLQVQETMITTEISETEKNFEMKETYTDFISQDNSIISCDSKCSRCGKDLSDEETKNITKFSDTETCRTLNSISTRNVNLKVPTKTSISSMKTSSRTSVMKHENLPTECPLNCNKNLINNNRGYEDLESCKCPSNSNCDSSMRINKRTENTSEKNLNQRNTKFKSKYSKKYHSSSSNKTRCKAKEDTSFLLSRRKNSFWRGSIVPGSFCSSFPALDRIKYLIRKKLRRLLLEERDKSTGTSKTYLKNDKYLVSISSGKLNEERICSSIRCPFTTRNRVDSRSPQTTFTEGSSLRKDAFEGGLRGKCRRMIQDNDIFRKIKLTEVSRFLCQKDSSKIDNHRIINEKDQGHRDGRRRGRSSAESFGSTKVIFFEDDKMKRKSRRKSSKRILTQDIPSSNLICRKNCRGRGDTLRDDRSRTYEKRLFKYCTIEDCDDDNDFMNLLSSYERRISDLDADFRTKLLQYVALCRSVKDLLMKRLPRPDDVYEGSSSSV